MIAEQYINDGLRIRRDYIKNLKKILEQEDSINEKKEKFLVIQSEMENIVHSDMNDVKKTLILNTKLLQIDKQIKEIQNIIRPYYDNIENLRTEKDRLYLSIKEKYPKITEQEIENSIMSRAKE